MILKGTKEHFVKHLQNPMHTVLDACTNLNPII